MKRLTAAGIAAIVLSIVYGLLQIAPYALAVFWNATPPHRAQHAALTIVLFCIACGLVVLICVRAYGSPAVTYRLRRFALVSTTVAVVIGFGNKIVLFFGASAAMFASSQAMLIALPLSFVSNVLALLALVLTVF